MDAPFFFKYKGKIMTEREAVNEILLSLNELPLTDSDVIDDIQTAIICQAELRLARKKILVQGWFFNTLDIDLYPNTEGYIPIPNTFLSVDGGATETELVVRDWKLFDKANLTYIFDEAKNCIVIEDISFDDIPFTIADYIVQSAALQAYIKVIGSSDDVRIRQEALILSRIEALREDARNIDGNLLDSDHVTGLVTR